MDSCDRTVAERFRQQLETLTPVSDLRVFGSRARGDATPESDLDLFVHLPAIDPALRRQIFDIAWEVGFDADRVIAVFVVTDWDLAEGATGASSIVANVMHEGISV
jgi:DNA polymerase sigma